MQQHLSGISLVVLLFLASCDYRTPSDVRMKNHTKLELPDNFIVLKDEYVEAGKDYSIQYNVVLDDRSMKETVDHIRTSKNFSQSEAEKNNVWTPAAKGYYFFLAEDGISYEVIVDTTTNIIYYNEAG
jgi:hypothetical protein